MELTLPWRWKPRADVLVNEIIAKCKDGLTIEQASQLIYRSTQPMHKIWAEDILDSLWETGFIVCMGHYRNYVYVTTPKGNDYLLSL